MITAYPSRRDVRHQSGYTMLELLIAMTIGGIMVGSVLLAVSGTGLTGRRQGSHAQFTEDGQVAINILSQQLRMATFWLPVSPLPSLDQNQAMVFGCSNGFASLAVTFPNLTCATGGGGAAIATLYEGRRVPGEPLGTVRDCLGNTGTPLNSTDNGMVYNRFYIATAPSGNPALYCRGNGSTAGQPLVENVESMQIRYGVAALTPPSTTPVIFDNSIFAGSTVRYVDAGFFTTRNCPRNAPLQTSWCSVTNIRVCLIMRSNDNMAEQVNSPYVDCDGNVVSQADRRLRRAMTTTIALRNRT